MADEHDPVAPLVVLGKRVVEELDKLGLHVENFAVLPNFGDGPHMAQVVVSFSGESVGEIVTQDDAQKETDAMFKEIMREEKKAEEATKFSDAEEALRKLAEELDGGGGILGDDNT